MSSQYIIDTHALVWFLSADPRLSSAVKELLVRAEEDDVTILVPTIVMAEALTMVEKGKVTLTVSELVEAVKETERFTIVPLDALVFDRMLSVTPALELPRDRRYFSDIWLSTDHQGQAPHRCRRNCLVDKEQPR